MIYCYDIEIFPNFFSCIFSNVEDDFDEYIFIISVTRNDSAELKKFVKGKTLVGYNSLMFDNVLLNAAIEGYSLQELYELGQRCISEDVGPVVWKFRNASTPYKSIDLMAIYAFDKLGVSLKQISILLKWHNVQELDIPFQWPVKSSQIQKILQYNSNDVQITKQLYKKTTELLELRRGLSKVYGVDLINASDSKIANIILEKMYSEQTGLFPERFKLQRTPRSVIYFIECLADCVSFTEPEFQTLEDQIKNTTYFVGSDYKNSVEYKNKKFTIGTGGLHSQDDPGIFQSDDEYEIWDADATSYYIKLMLRYRIKPEHLSDDFFVILLKLMEDRIKAKEAGDDIKAQGLKITILSIFGKLGFDSFWLYDPKAFYNVTLSGQLCLLMLVERFGKADIQVISANTDGITCKVHKSEKELYRQICDQWEQDTDIKLEYIQYAKYFRKDVNNYLAVYMDGKLKKKGFFIDDILLTKGYKHPIVPFAVNKYFLESVPVQQTILDSTDIHDFFMFEKPKRVFRLEFKDQSGVTQFQRISRFYACLTGGELYKTDGERKISLCAGVPVKVLNSIPLDSKFEDFQVNKNYYIQEAQKIIDKIESIQPISLSLW